MALYRRPGGDATRARIMREFEQSPQLPHTYQELADKLGIRVNSIKHHIGLLIADGVLVRTQHKSRGVKLAPKADEARP